MCSVCESPGLAQESAEAMRRRAEVRRLGHCPICLLAEGAEPLAPGEWCRYCRRYSLSP